jgi:hypothetical protein
MPVEVTVPEGGFYGAWRIGAREWRSAADGGLAGEEGPKLYPMKESWTVYPPVTVPGVGDRLPDMPEEGELVRRFGEVMERLGRAKMPGS